MTQPTPKHPTFILPKRYCANPACKRELPPETPRHYSTCCYSCYLVVKAQEAEVEAADKLPVKQPF